MPIVHRAQGFAFFFRASDRAEPPHVHVRGNAGKAKIWLVPEIELARSHRYTSRQGHLIIVITEEHKLEWLSAWHRFFGR